MVMTPQQRYVLNHPDRVRASKRKYAEKPENLEHKRTSSRERYARERERVMAQKLRWQRDNPEAVKLQRRATEMNRRARKLGLPGHLKASEMFRLGTPCSYCGSTEKTGTDHVIPLSRGGSNTVENIVPCCIPCNSSKRNKLLSEWSGRCKKSA